MSLSEVKYTGFTVMASEIVEQTQQGDVPSRAAEVLTPFSPF